MEFVVPESKVVNYLLANPSKRGFLLSFGYSVQDWPRLRDDILRLGRNFPLIYKRDTEYGKKYEITGEIHAPDGRVIKLTTGWMVDHENPDICRFITAYPA
jgi:hypothetical protein